jgi:hypothetical protein
VNGRVRTIDFHAIEENSIAVARDAWVEMPGLISDWQLERAGLDFHIAAAHGVAADDAGIGIDFTTAGEAEFFAKVIFLRRAGSEKFHAFGNFHQTLATLAGFAAGGGDLHAERFRAIKKRLTGRGGFLKTVNVKHDTHTRDSSFGLENFFKRFDGF